MGVAAVDLFLQDLDLGMLTAEAQNGGASHVGVMNVTGEQAAQIVGILTRAAATAFMYKEFNAVDVAKHSGRRFSRLHGAEGERFQCVGLPFAMEAREFSNLASVNLRCDKAEFFFEGLLQNSEIAVLAEDQRKKQPVIARADLAVCTMKAGESFVAPGRNIWRSPGSTGLFGFLKSRSRMANVARG